MCTDGRRIESRSVCLTKPKQSDPKKLNLEYKPCEIMVGNNIVCKTIR